MLQYSEEEKRKAKEAKIAFKKKQQPRIMTSLKVAAEAKHPVFNLKGIIEGEELLPDNYPVHWDYLYVVGDNGGKVIRSDVKGTIADLKRDLKTLGMEAERIYSCNLVGRNIL
jgi:hypothetical protein